MEGIKYVPPKDVARTEEELPHHRFELRDGAELIGAAEIDYLSKPLPIYQVTNVYVEYDLQRRGHASHILDKVERWLVERGKPGVLLDAIPPGEPQHGMYRRRGWVPISEGSDIHVFNWPPDVDMRIMKNYSRRYTDHLDRRSRT